MLHENERKNIVTKVADRILKNIEELDGYSKKVAVEKLVAMLDDTSLIALDFSVDMTPTAKKEGTHS